ncbi:class I SAM-dependent methyltransferase [Brucella intermedia]|uniref:class I SAM-dependent methyltransferase n=1 Tax=Brucella intermedia TaxID=94625 RepID=UPI002248D270|nr:class I SAM-dependent methyltransferase [Brucella intermedia]
MTGFPDQAALDYDDRIKKLVPGYELALQLFGCVLTERVDPRGSILVPGCGTGSEILALAAILPDVRFTAVEPSMGMLEKARFRLTEAGVNHRVDFIHGLLSDAPIKTYTAASLSLVLHFLPDDGSKAGFLKEIAQRLEPHSPLLLLDPLQKDDGIILRRWLEGQGHVPEIAGAICRRMDAEWHRITPQRLDELLNVSGFTPSAMFFQSPGYTGLVAERKCDE